MPFLRNPNGTITQLTLPASVTLGGVATGCNDHRMAVGYGYTKANNPIALVWTTPDNPVAIGDFGGGKGEALGINNNGEVVGFAFDAQGVEHAFTWSSAAGLVDLSTVLGGTGYVASGVNDSGVVVGYAVSPARGFLYTPSSGQIWKLPTDGGLVSDGLAVNSTGEAVGTTTDAKGIFHNCVWGANGFGSMNDPSGTVQSQANGVNSAGTIVGTVENSTGILATRWLPTSTPNAEILDSITSGVPSGVTLSNTAGIDTNGDILCEGSDHKAYLLQPTGQ